jgi:NADH-quinone oxidoreductase subunit J
LQAIAFYLLAIATVVAGLLVVSARNPVHSVLFLITAFFSAAGLFVLMGAEFLAMLLIVVYVGAVAVLFLFVVMMLDVDFAELRQGFAQYLPFGGWSPVVLAGDDGRRRDGRHQRRGGRERRCRTPRRAACPTPRRSAGCSTPTTSSSSRLAGLVLLVAMIGAIVLTLRHKPGVKRQDIGKQVARTPKTGMESFRSSRARGSTE